MKQSLPFSYLSVSAVSTDELSHDVSVYTDISGEWLTSNDALAINWTTTTGAVLTHQSQLETQTVYGESNDRILRECPRYDEPMAYFCPMRLIEGSIYYSTENVFFRQTNQCCLESDCSESRLQVLPIKQVKTSSFGLNLSTTVSCQTLKTHGFAL